MKRTLLTAVVMSTALFGCNQQAADAKPNSQPAVQESAKMALDTEEKRVSYGMGIGLGDRVRQDGIAMDLDAFSQGVRDAIEGSERLMTDEEIMQEMQAFQQQQMEKQQAVQLAEANKNKQVGEQFLAENAKKEGVTTLESGLQYKVITESSGAKPASTDTVEVHYRGTLVDGTEFDSSYKRNSTVSFPVNGVIPGWTEALQLMSVGSKWELYIPSDLAYGPAGTRGGPIGANAALIFEVELVAIQAAE
jgi:FKBP-type peptidyl-prolyl cis-trans isomerase